jgi:hypothetical protein
MSHCWPTCSVKLHARSFEPLIPFTEQDECVKLPSMNRQPCVYSARCLLFYCFSRVCVCVCVLALLQVHRMLSEIALKLTWTLAWGWSLRPSFCANETFTPALAHITLLSLSLSPCKYVTRSKRTGPSSLWEPQNIAFS